jgi:hypothetical protein
MVGWIFTVRATHLPSGLYQDADGSCEFSEKAERQRTLHNVRAHALTRAKNRAILDLVGFGEVSAEEIIDDKRAAPRRQSKPKAKTDAKSAEGAAPNKQTPEPPEDPVWPWKPHGGKKLGDVPLEALRDALDAKIPAKWRERIVDEIAVREGKMPPAALAERWGQKQDPNTAD